MTQNPQVDGGQRFGKFLRRVRENRKLSLDAAAELTTRLPGRVTKSHLSRIENGTAEPTFPRMFSLARVYGVPISQFAERFEADLRRSLVPANVEALSSAALYDEAELLRDEGRYEDALLRYELLLERAVADATDDVPLQPVNTLQLHRANCLMMLACYALAKDEVELVLTRRDLTQDERASAIQLFAQCCYRLERYELARMAVGVAEGIVATLPEDNRHHAHLLQLKGNLHYVMGEPKIAAVAFKQAIESFERLGPDHDVCRQRMNYGQALRACGQHKEAVRQLKLALRHAEKRGYESTKAYVLHALGAAAFARDQLEAAESLCLQSNVIARQRENKPLVFCNCYYLWQIALARNDAAAAATHERALRAYVERMPEQLDEVRLYREKTAGGGS